MQQRVRRSIAADLRVGIVQLGQGALLHRNVVLDVQVGRRRTLVSEPQCDVLDIDARLQ
jgi:hypothetical protein